MLTKRTAAMRWIALLDRAEEMMATASPYDPCGMRKVGQAVRSVHLYEHTLTDEERRLARVLLWRRDHSEPLPEDLSTWSQCCCRECQLALRLARPAPPVASVIVVPPVISSVDSTPTQGVFLTP